MARSQYFSQRVDSEADLMEDIIIESLKIYGFDCYYLPRTVVSVDNILNEDIESRFDSSYLIEMYLENTDGFDGEGTLFSKFGLEIRDQASLVVAKKRWNELVGVHEQGTISNRPAEGDLIYVPMTKSLFEIKYVQHDKPFYQLNDLPLYTMTCELFESSNEDLDTGIDDIDSIQTISATEYILNVNDGNGTNFTVGENVTQSITGGEIYGEVLAFNSVSGESYYELKLGLIKTNTGKFGTFVTGTDIIGQTSGAEWNVLEIYDIKNNPDPDKTFGNNQQGQNASFETEADGFIDFSEENPFGEIS